MMQNAIMQTQNLMDQISKAWRLKISNAARKKKSNGVERKYQINILPVCAVFRQQ
jgi:hypothetical protein